MSNQDILEEILTASVLTLAKQMQAERDSGSGQVRGDELGAAISKIKSQRGWVLEQFKSK